MSSFRKYLVGRMANKKDRNNMKMRVSILTILVLLSLSAESHADEGRFKVDVDFTVSNGVSQIGSGKAESIRPVWKMGYSHNPSIGFRVNTGWHYNRRTIVARTGFEQYLKFGKTNEATKAALPDYQAFAIFIGLLEDEEFYIDQIEVTNPKGLMVVGYENACVRYSYLDNPKPSDSPADKAKSLVRRKVLLKAVTLVENIRSATTVDYNALKPECVISTRPTN